MRAALDAAARAGYAGRMHAHHLSPAERHARLGALEDGTDTETALAFFDALPHVDLAAMIGSWRGRSFATGHPFDGLLERFGWHGKRFESSEEVQPLVFDTPSGQVDLNPRFVPARLLLRGAGLLQHAAIAQVFHVVAPLFRTRRPRARLRMTEHRGVLTASMIYDDLPIVDVFRGIDAETVIGLMDLRGMERPFFFLLRREG